MKSHYLKLTGLSLALAISACSSPDRSRDLNDASIPASTTAVQVCANCHGAKGVATSPNFPNLAALPEPYLEKQITAFRTHDRSDPFAEKYMWGLSQHLTDDQIKGLATYFSKLPPSPGNLDDFGTTAMKEEGKAIFEHGIESKGVPACATCHGAHAEGVDQFPRLAGQHADYIVKQLHIFQETNTRPDAVAMKPVAQNLTQENMESVAAYLATLSPASN